MNILLIINDFFPNKAGIAHSINSLCKLFPKKDHTLFIINPFYKGNNIFPLFIKNAHILIDIPKFLKKKYPFYIKFII
jgi:hypothetical protein